MGLSSTMYFVKQLLDGQNAIGNAGGYSPGQGAIRAYVSPPDPNLESGPPTCYVWTSRGSGKRNSGPRSKPPLGKAPTTGPGSPAGWKLRQHNLSIWCVWFDDSEDPGQDSNFPWFVDTVINVLETCQMPMALVDAASGMNTQLINLGENVDYEYVPIRGTASQRYTRSDAQITAPVEEWIQA